MNFKTLLPILILSPLALVQTASAAATSSAARSQAEPPLSLGPVPHYLADAPQAEPAPVAGGWQLSLSIPIWIAGIGGDLTVKGHEFSPDQDTGDVIDILDTHLNMAAALHLEAQKERFGLIFDGMYIDLRSTGNRGLTNGEAVFKGYLFEFDGFYSFIAPEAGKRGLGAFRLDGLAGMRITTAEIGVNGDGLSVSANTTFFDPIVGARLELGLTDWLSLKLRGDVGGFGIDAWNASDFVWNIEPGLELHLAKWFDLGLGYRWLKYDFVSESETSKFDATLSGPVLTLKFNL